MSRSPVQVCAEFKRIDALPRRVAAVDAHTVERVSAMMLRPGAVGALRPIQVQALLECLQSGGMLGPIRVGAGKTLISFLAPTICGAQRPVLLVPAKLREKTIHEYVEAARTWRVHPRLTVDSYQMQSRADHAARMLDHAPDMLILDECHALKSPLPAVTRRITRYVERGCSAHEDKDPRCAECVARVIRVVPLSGTLIRADIRDAAHLAAWALGAGSPFPRTWTALETWGAAMDQKRDPGEHAADAGVLLRWAKGDTVSDVREGFRDRVRQTPGVIATTDAGPEIPLVLERWSPASSPEIDRAVEQLAATWQLPDGRDIEDPLRQTDALNTLALGFWYRWRVEPPKRWLHTRRLWAWFVRQTIAARRYQLDSVEQVARACRDGAIPVPTIAELLEEREERCDHRGIWWTKSDKPVPWDVDPTAPIATAWRDVAPTFEPESEARWFDDSVAQQAARWAQETGGIVWTQFGPFGRRLDDLGVPYYGAGGLRAGVMIERASGPVAASVAANSEGRNLQSQWSRSLVTSVRGGRQSAAGLEQLIARTHRDGQTSESVRVAFMLVHEHQSVAFASVLNGARYLEQTTGQPQKLTIATNATGI